MIRRFLHSIYLNFTEEQSRHFALVPIFFGLGIGLYFSLSFEPRYWICLVVIEFLLLIFYLARHKEALHLPLFALFLITLGFANAQLHTLYQSRRIEKSAMLQPTFPVGLLIFREVRKAKRAIL